MEIDYYESQPHKHCGLFKFKCHIYKDVLDSFTFKQVYNLVDKTFEVGNTTTFLIHKTVFNYESKSYKIVTHNQNNRKQHVFYDMINTEGYYYNTVDTIFEYSHNQLKSIAHPIFYKIVNLFESVAPLNKEPGCWIPMRGHANIWEHGMTFLTHRDSDPIWYKVRQREARMLSMTFYLDTISLGGELWSATGFVYKPKPNTALMFNGNQIPHGVNQNNDDRKIVRKAFTLRWAHKEDLFLPGHPTKTLYTVASDY